MELGERPRGAQTPAARALLSGDGEGGPEGFLGRSGVGGIEHEQDFAAKEMREREIALTFNLAREGQRFVDARQRAVSSDRPQLELREHRFGDQLPISSCSAKAA